MSRLVSTLAATAVLFGSAVGQDPKKDEVPKFRGKSAEQWAAGLADKDLAVRKATVIDLATPKEKSEPPAEFGKALSPHLIDRLTDDDRIVCVHAALAWARMNRYGPVPERDLPILTAVLRDALADPSIDVRARAATALVRVNTTEKAVLAPLAKLLSDSSEGVRSSVAFALGSVTPGAAAVPSLVAALKDKSHRVRRAAAVSLGHIGESAKAAVPYLIATAKDGDQWVRVSAVRALGRIRTDPDKSIPALIEALKDSTTEEAAAIALESYGPAAKAAVPVLCEVAKSGEEFSRYHALEALIAIDPRGAATLASLTEAVKDQEHPVQCVAANGLKNFGPKAKEAVPELLRLFKEGSSAHVRKLAAEALAAIDSDAAKKAGAK
jgi:HEAT repeat protein